MYIYKKIIEKFYNMKKGELNKMDIRNWDWL